MCQSADFEKIFGPLFQEEGMKKIRQRVVKRFNFFTHVTSRSYLAEIISCGLRPSDPAAGGYVPEFPTELIGKEALFLTPFGSDITMPVQKPLPHVKLAVAANDLPEFIFPDWSYECYFSEMLKLHQVGNSIEESFMRVAIELGSVGCLNTVNADKLRVCVAESEWHSNPENWPLLVETADDAIFKNGAEADNNSDWFGDFLKKIQNKE